ncbi:protein vav-like [Uloborus diversus]|uniref:protein vav-like n=1 Tax=Uloborus diversus TaxID=327109 RepID=UPI002409E34B|nr:protein vav-like [Uloborus diversus]
MAEILWRECADWLIRHQVLLPDHRVTWPSAQVIDLVYTLRDGVLLCQLLNKLVPGCIDLKEISLRPQMSQFLCLKNIRTFLQTCQNVFDVSASDLFEPSMLFDCSDFGKVLHTLSVLSKTGKAETSGIKGFPSFSKNHDYYNDEIYRNLEDMANEADYAVHMDQPYALVEGEETYDVYEDIVQCKRSKSSASHSLPVEKRDYCIKELIETEKNYIEALNMIIKHFMRPLKSILKPETRKVIFMNIKELAEIHTGFHSELYKACTSSQYKISECFLHWKNKFIIYGEYCSSLPAAQELVEDLSNRNEVVNQAILRCQQEANGGKFKLRDLLSVPMQRILKYHLLLNELIKNTPKTHDDYLNLQKALDSMVDLAHYINEVKRDNETLQIIRDIENSITDLRMPDDLELKDYGRLLKDGELKIRSHDDNRLKNRYVFLFEKVMLMCKSTRGEQYSFKEALVMLDYKVEDMVNTIRVGNRDKWSYYWLLAHRQNKTALTMYAKTEELKKKWVEAIEKALDNVCPSSLHCTDHMFLLHSFEKATVCAECEKLLKGIFFQGYRCAVCSVAVHKDCIPHVRSCGAPRLPPRPSNAVLVPQVLRRNLSSASNKPYMFKVRARFAYGGPPDHLSFDSDDEIYVTKQINNMCWEGYCTRTGKSGMFPPDHVEKRPPSYENPFTNKNGLPCATPAPDYMNTMLEGHDWFAGVMDRETATKKLEELLSGTFLLRISPKQNGSHVISINYQNQVKHMRVCSSDNGQHFYLSETKYFKSIVELINWYQENSLAESFSGLHVTLMIPYKKAISAANVGGILGLAEALYDFDGHSPNLLTLHKGDRITLLSKAGNQKGWWKGQIEENVGYFPYSYVREIIE